MNCCQCQGIEDLFNEKAVQKELADYQAKGPSRTTRLLTRDLVERGVQGATLLDVGGGVGAVQHSLLAAGAASATDVDASQAYLRAASAQARRLGLAERIRFVHGNFIELTRELDPAEIVTMDRVLCCFPDVDGMVESAAKLSRRWVGLVYPRDSWWARLGVHVLNLVFRLQKNPFRTFVHPTRRVEEILAQHGFQRRSLRHTMIWQVAVFEK